MRVGILGAGQLARMLALAGQPLGISFVFVDPAADACAGGLGELIVADYADHKALDLLASKVDVVTLDFENVPVQAVQRIAERVPVLPGARALEVAQDRLLEKQFFAGLGIATAEYAPVDSRDSLVEASRSLGDGAIVKTRRLGYDGKGQFVLRSADDIDQAWAALSGQDLILERRVPFVRELSVLIARSTRQEVAIWPLTENQHVNGILHRSVAPAPSAPEENAQKLARAVVEALDYVGVLAIELFELVDGQLLVNEMAPRVHNSGHWTIDGAVCSQFENHLRAVCGLPLGATATIGHSVMVNWIGNVPSLDAGLNIEGVHWHDYGKQPRAGRKVGHATVVRPQSEPARQAATELRKLAS